MDARCRIELFGGLRAQQGARTITRFRSTRTAVLLAYLAYFPRRAHSREELIELLWPEADLDQGRNSLSVALSSLRAQLEPPGISAGAVIIADRFSVRLNPAAVVTDVAEFETALRAGEGHGTPGPARAQALAEAVELYRGELLAGFYEEWLLPERTRLAERYLRALGQVASFHEQAGELDRALDLARRAVSADPLREESHRELMRLLAAAGQPAAALRQYRELEEILREELELSELSHR